MAPHEGRQEKGPGSAVPGRESETDKRIHEICDRIEYDRQREWFLQQRIAVMWHLDQRHCGIPD